MWKPSEWEGYGLDVMAVESMTLDELIRAVRGHTLVAAYLRRHPEVAAEYRADQTGKVRYFDVLALAEKEVDFTPAPLPSSRDEFHRGFFQWQKFLGLMAKEI